ncbi:MAG: NosD domain-containing protein [Candidatus Eisenbacteria bacterium]
MRTAVVTVTAVLILLAVVQVGPEARTLKVPEDFKGVQEAVGEATYGDTILVSPGTYKVQAKLRSGVKVLSTDGPDSTVLWNRRWHILELIDCDLETEISGFTFEGKGCNTCLPCTTGAPAITGNVIKNSWDGINLLNCNALVSGNTITGCNRGVYLEYSDPELIENTFTRNGDAVSMVGGAPVIARCTFEHNGRAFLIFGHSYPTIGGSLTTANNILTNGFMVYNAGLRIDGTLYTDEKEVAVATHNYWGSDCPDGKRNRGEVAFTPWTNAAHDSVFYDCPEAPIMEEDTSE